MEKLILNFLLRTVGQMSEGICLGLDTGFTSWQYVEYIYENRPRGITPLGLLIDKVFLSHPVTEGLRSRRQLLVDQLLFAIHCYKQPTVFDLAAGIGSYLFLLPPGKATIIAGEIDPEAVKQGSARSQKQNRFDIIFKQSNALEPLSFPVKHADIIVASGFFDYLPYDWVQKILKNGSSITGKDARWVFTTQNHHYDSEAKAKTDFRFSKLTLRAFESQAGVATKRSPEQIADWARPYGWELEKVKNNQYFAVATLVRKNNRQ